MSGYHAAVRVLKISASILGADFARLGEAVLAAERAGCAEVHFDVMDGRFVPNISIGLPVLEAIRPLTKLPIDIHMMVEEPARFAGAFAKAGGTMFTVHYEACADVRSTLDTARRAGMKTGIAIKPATPTGVLVPLLPGVDRVLVMSVEPGFGGQAFMPESLPKIEQLRRLADHTDQKFEVAVDGGVKSSNAGLAAGAGADTLISGTGIFKYEGGVNAAVLALKAAGQAGPSR
jgi:ribulose-phosphate 3-epimerase